MHTPPDGLSPPLLAEVRQLVNAARQRVASAVNAELTLLYRHIGRRINAELILCTGKSEEHVELLQLPQSYIRVADYRTLLPPRETLQAKLHQSIAIARQKLQSNAEQ